MAGFLDNIIKIQSSKYGKEMRPAINEALLQAWDKTKLMMEEVDKLDARLDALPDVGPDKPITPNGCSVVDDCAVIIGGSTTPLSAVGDAEQF